MKSTLLDPQTYQVIGFLGEESTEWVYEGWLSKTRFEDRSCNSQVLLIPSHIYLIFQDKDTFATMPPKISIHS